ncbi:MAG: type II toxin-antitoxin system RelE/ParE family toxin [Rhodospirillales bacterium]
MAYRIVFSRRARRQFLDLPAGVGKRLAPRIDSLAGNPRPRGAKRLSGTEDFYRIRVGDYRILYAIEHHELVVLAVKLGHRKDVYRGI